MVAKVLNFEIPDKIRRYPDPSDIFIDLETFEFDVKKTLGTIGKMIQDHRFLVLNTLKYMDYMKPYGDWTGITKNHVIEQRDKFNKILDKQVKDIPVVLLGGEAAILKKGKFILRDISDERQEVARITGIVSEVLFFEGIVYHRESLSWMKVEDYQIREAKFPKIREKENDEKS